MGGVKSGWNAKNEWHQQVWEGIKEDPWRLLTGFDPLATMISNAVLGRDDEPLGDWFGGPTTDQLRSGRYDRGEHKAANDMKVMIPLLVGGILGGGAIAGGAAGGAGGGAGGGGGFSAFGEVGIGGIGNSQPWLSGGGLQAAGGGGAGGAGYNWQQWAKQAQSMPRQQQPEPYQWEEYPLPNETSGPKGALSVYQQAQAQQVDERERTRKRLLAEALAAMRTY